VSTFVDSGVYRKIDGVQRNGLKAFLVAGGERVIILVMVRREESPPVNWKPIKTSIREILFALKPTEFILYRIRLEDMIGGYD